MIISIEKLKSFTSIDMEDQALRMRLSALESLIRKHTNNNFQNRNIRTVAKVVNGTIYGDFSRFKPDDTIQISDGINAGLYVIEAADETSATVDKDVEDVGKMLVTKVEYPDDVVMGAINMLNYDMTMRKKQGIQSETISRHSVTYFNQDGANTSMGYPKSLVGFLEPYKKARF